MKQMLQITSDFRLPSRRGKGRRVELYNHCRNAEGGPKEKNDVQVIVCEDPEYSGNVPLLLRTKKDHGELLGFLASPTTYAAHQCRLGGTRSPNKNAVEKSMSWCDLQLVFKDERLVGQHNPGIGIRKHS